MEEVEDDDKPKCETCGDCGMVRLTEKDEPLPYYFFCGCRYHTWCPDCTWFIRRWIERLVLWLRPVS